MATKEDIDEAEELRFLALKSMVKRSKKKKSTCKTEEVDDPDILLLRAAALKTITHKKQNKSSTLVNKNEKPLNGILLNEKKRNNNQVTSPRNKKSKNLNERQIYISVNTKNTNQDKFIKKSKNVSEQEHKEHEHNPKLELEPNYKSNKNDDTVNKDDLKKIVRNGSIQLSNLDSEKVDETMVISITFSSSESDDSSCEYKTIKEDRIIQKNTTCNIRNEELQLKTTINDMLCNNTENCNHTLEYNRLKMNNCLKNICELMEQCESEIEVRNQQLKILLDVYEKYQNCNKSLFSILQSIKTARNELSIYNSLVTKTNGI